MNPQRTGLRLIRAVAVTAGLLSFAGISAQEVPGYPRNIRAYDPREVAMLPGYCIHTQDFRERVPGGGDRQQIERWTLSLGEEFNHLHHYCWGLMNQNRAKLLARDSRTRDYYWAESVQEFDYVITHARAGFVLLPEILTRKGEALIRLGQGPKALLDLERAAELKPDYWPAYAAISDYYKELGQIEKAREALDRGLSFAPDSKGLRRRLAELEAPPPGAQPSLKGKK
jgi:tetratricopeptide (TPR) repeat protein